MLLWTVLLSFLCIPAVSQKTRIFRGIPLVFGSPSDAPRSRWRRGALKARPAAIWWATVSFPRGCFLTSQPRLHGFLDAFANSAPNRSGTTNSRCHSTSGGDGLLACVAESACFTVFLSIFVDFGFRLVFLRFAKIRVFLQREPFFSRSGVVFCGFGPV